MKNLTTIPPFDAETRALNVIVESPRGSRNKYVFDPSNQMFLLKKLLPAGLAFPFDFGFVPSTCAPDGDPLDVVLLSEAPLFPGCLVQAHLLGAIKAEQRNKRRRSRNDRLIAVPRVKNRRELFTRLNQLPALQLHEIEQFFIDYLQAEGAEFKVLGRAGAKEARRLVNQGAQAAAQPSRTDVMTSRGRSSLRMSCFPRDPHGQSLYI
jgi:inorganic pyrophosphatase